ncbi:MAG: SUMF1/EgtB/PvdO family nonheme iron enzyme [Bacteroidia bacterium]
MMTEYSNVLKLLTECENLVSSGKTKQALTRISSLKDEEINAKVLKLSSQYNLYEGHYKLGQLPYEEFVIRINRITDSTLDIITNKKADLLKKEKVVNTGNLKKNANISFQKLTIKEFLLNRRSRKYALIIGGLLILFFFKDYAIHLFQADIEVPFVEMVSIEEGRYEMGSKFDDVDKEEDEELHPVRISGFQLAKFAVSNKEFVKFLNDIRRKISIREDGIVEYNGNEIFSIYCTGECTYWKQPINNSEKSFYVTSGFENHPVVLVSWYGAVEYCNWLSNHHDYKRFYTIDNINVTPNWKANGYRLPTEAEWEFAARGGGKGYYRYAWGESKSDTVYANLSGVEDGYIQTAPVDKFPQGELNLFSMSGNVWEWCWDWYDASYYHNSDEIDPKGEPKGIYRTLRGGAWYGKVPDARTSNRAYDLPGLMKNNIGFRLSRSGM